MVLYIFLDVPIQKKLQDSYNPVYKVFHNLATTLSSHCDKLVFETCSNLVKSLKFNSQLIWHIQVGYTYSRYAFIHHDSLPVEANIDVSIEQYMQLTNFIYYVYKRFKCNLTNKYQYSLWYSVFISTTLSQGCEQHCYTRLS